MILRPRPFLITLVAFAVAIVLTLLVLAGIVDLSTIGFETEIPTSAVLTPMVAVVSFWGVSRVFGVPLDPARTFLLGAIMIYGVLFFVGRVVALTALSSSLATIVACLVLFVLGYLACAMALNDTDQQV